MKKPIYLFFTLLIASHAPAADVVLYPGVSLCFADAEEGRAILGAEDEYSRNTSALERQFLLQSPAPVSEEELLAFVASEAQPWSQAEIDELTLIAESIAAKLSRLEINLPKTVYLIKTTDNAAYYTRQNAIVVPGGSIWEDILIHELFHVFSRHNPDLRDSLYGILGYKPAGGPIELPETLRERKFTNPDAPRTAHYITLRHHGETVNAAPFLISPVDEYRPFGSFFDFMRLGFLVLEPSGGGWRAAYEDGAPRVIYADGTGLWYSVDRVFEDFYEQNGRNTDYIIHPEETLADNFVFLVNGHCWHLPTPRIVKEMAEIFRADVGNPLVLEQPARAFPWPEGYPSLEFLAFAPDGGQILTTIRREGTLVWLGLETGAPVREWDFEGSTITAQYTQQGLRLVTQTAPDTVRLWDAESGGALHPFTHDAAITQAVLAGDGRSILTADSSGLAVLWDAWEGYPLQAFPHNGEIRAMVLSPDGSKALTVSSGDETATAALWDAASGAPLHTFGLPYPAFSSAFAAAFSPDGGRFMTGGGFFGYSMPGYGNAHLRDSETGELLQAYETFLHPVNGVQFSRGGAMAVIGSRDGTVSFWDASGKERCVIRAGVTGWDGVAAVSPDENWALTASGGEGIRFWDISSLQRQTPVSDYALHE